MAAKSENIFVKAKAYQKKHPRTSWAECIQKVKGKKKVSGTKKKISAPKAKVCAAVGKVKRKKIASSPRKSMTRVPGKKTSSLQRGRVLVNRIKVLELKRKEEKARELKDLIQLEINACHDRLDALKKPLRRRSA